jgi:hypothetical protein
VHHVRRGKHVRSLSDDAKRSSKVVMAWPDRCPNPFQAYAFVFTSTFAIEILGRPSRPKPEAILFVHAKGCTHSAYRSASGSCRKQNIMALPESGCLSPANFALVDVFREEKRTHLSRAVFILPWQWVSRTIVMERS